jgi:hypothetical protein
MRRHVLQRLRASAVAGENAANLGSSWETPAMFAVAMWRLRRQALRSGCRTTEGNLGPPRRVAGLGAYVQVIAGGRG